MKKEIKIRCQYSKKGLETFGKQRRGYAIGESRSGGYGKQLKVQWDGLKTPRVYAESFIEINPLIELYVDDDGVEKEKPVEPAEGAEITPEAILNIERGLKSLEKHGLNERAIVVLIKDYCGAKVGLTKIREVLKALDKIKSFYFKK